MRIKKDKIKGGGWGFLLFFLLTISITAYSKPILHNYFVGINGALLENTKRQLAVKQDAITNLNKETIETFYNKDASKEIAKALEPFGYFRTKVTTNLTKKNDTWNAVFHIELGPPLKITSLNIKISGEGEKDPIFKKFLSKNPLKVGSILQTEQYKILKQNFINLASKNGYLNASIEKNLIQIDLRKYTSAVILHFNTGAHYKFGKIHFSKIPLSESFLRRFLTFKEGDFYTTKKIIETQENLNNSNYFGQIIITPEETKLLKNNVVPVEITLTPRKAKQYDFGLGFGTDTGIRGLLGMELRYLTKTGQHFKAFIKASRVQSDAEVHYLIPGKNPTTDQYDLSGAFETISQSYGSSNAYKIAAGYTTSVFKNWQETWRLSLQREHYDINFQDRFISKNNSFLLIPSYNLFRTVTDNPIHPTHGNRINISIQGAVKNALSNATFLQAKLDAKYIFPLSSVNNIVLRGTLGYTAINNIGDLPLSLQYFAGGTQSVRGYGYNKIGPERDLIIVSLEFRQKIVQNWYLTAFLDAGNADNSFAMKLKRGLGAGIAWLSPVGTMELTYAQALDLNGRPGMVQFSMGPEF